jgi:hypothetical protein
VNNDTPYYPQLIKILGRGKEAVLNNNESDEGESKRRKKKEILNSGEGVKRVSVEKE